MTKVHEFTFPPGVLKTPLPSAAAHGVSRVCRVGELPLSLTRHNLGLFGALAIIGLRLTIGFHFFSEGLDKLNHPKPFTAQFLGAAKGPFAGYMKSYVWDADGLLRLGYTPSATGYPTIDLSATEKYWENYAQRVSNHYRFDAQQGKRAGRVLARYKRDLSAFSKDYRAEIIEYFRGVERGRQQAATQGIQRVDSLRGQADQWLVTLRGQAAPLLRQVDSMWSGLERDLNAIATAQQRERHDRLAIGKLQASGMDADTIDKIVPWFDLLVGLSLLAGLLTRIGAIAGATFLAMVVASQWPGSLGAAPTWPQLVEMFALLSLAAVNAGQYGGLDFFVRAARAKCCPPKRGTEKI